MAQPRKKTKRDQVTQPPRKERATKKSSSTHRRANTKNNSGNDGGTKQLVEWVAAEANTLQHVTQMMRKALKKVDGKVNPKTIHKARVSLRHFFAIWSVLKDDGWEDHKFRSKVVKPLDSLLSELGDARDVDTNIELGEKIQISKQLQKKWEADQKEHHDRVRQELDDLGVKEIRKRLKDFANEAPSAVSSKLTKSHGARESAKHHLAANLDNQEQVVRALSQSLATPDDYHKFRLSLKRWRYLLEDLFGAEQSDLENAQSRLGELHDCDRVKEILTNEENTVAALANLNELRNKLLADVDGLKNALPFGYRPPIRMKRPVA